MCGLYSEQVPDEESQPSTEVDLFVSAEKIMVLDTGHRVSLLTIIHQQLVTYILSVFRSGTDLVSTYLVLFVVLLIVCPMLLCSALDRYI